MHPSNQANLPAAVDTGVQRLESAFDQLANRLTSPGQKIQSARRNFRKVAELPWGKIALGTLAFWLIVRRLRS